MHAIGLIIASYKPWYLGLYRSMCMHIVFRQDVLLWQSVDLGPGVGQVDALKRDMKQPHGAFLLLEQAITVVFMQMQAAVCSVALVSFWSVDCGDETAPSWGRLSALFPVVFDLLRLDCNIDLDQCCNSSDSLRYREADTSHMRLAAP